MDQVSAMRAFARVVQTGSFSAVAREQRTSQATISKKVASLEAHLGVKLISRSSRRQSLTESGEKYYEQCVLILAELDETNAAARAQSASPRGILRVSAPVALGRMIVSPMITDSLPNIPRSSLTCC